MVKTSSAPTDTATTTLYVCRACGTGVEDTEPGSECPECGGQLRDTSVPHD